MTSTPYQPSSPGLGAPDNTRHVPQARWRPNPLRSTSIGPRASAYLGHSPLQDTRHTHPCDFHSAPPVVFPLAPAPPTPLPVSSAAEGPSRALPAARCRRTSRRIPPPSRGSRLLEPSPP